MSDRITGPRLSPERSSGRPPRAPLPSGTPGAYSRPGGGPPSSVLEYGSPSGSSRGLLEVPSAPAVGTPVGTEITRRLDEEERRRFERAQAAGFTPAVHDRIVELLIAGVRAKLSTPEAIDDFIKKTGLCPTDQEHLQNKLRSIIRLKNESSTTETRRS